MTWLPMAISRCQAIPKREFLLLSPIKKYKTHFNSDVQEPLKNVKEIAKHNL